MLENSAGLDFPKRIFRDCGLCMFLRVRVNNYLYIYIYACACDFNSAFLLLRSSPLSLYVCMYLTYVYTCVVRVSVYACRCVYAKENDVTSVEIATRDRLCVEIR